MSTAVILQLVKIRVTDGARTHTHAHTRSPTPTHTVGRGPQKPDPDSAPLSLDVILFGCEIWT